MTGAVAVVTLGQERVVVGHDVAGVGDERQPGSRLGRGALQAGAVAGMIDHRLELMLRDAWREPLQGGFEGGAAAHRSTTPVIVACRCTCTDAQRKCRYCAGAARGLPFSTT